MPKSNAAATASSMLSDLKARLGFSHDDGGDDAGSFDEYDDFDDEGFNERDDREYAGYGADYDDRAPVGGFEPATAHTGRFGRADSTPNLVSIDDVKSRTRTRDGRTDAQPVASSRPTRVGARNLIDDRAPATSSPAYHASLRDREREAAAGSADGMPYRSDADAGSRRDSLHAYQGFSSGQAALSGTRGLVLVSPVAYADAERVTRALKSGDAVVLVMRNTPDDLAKRILDFAFGAASALDASVECPAEKVFAIARGAALTEDEKRQLRAQGVIR